MLQGNTDKYNKSKVRWACRRGMLELDKILMNFFDQEFEGLSDEKKSSFIKLLDHNDNELYTWLIGDEVPTEYDLQDLVLCIRHLAIADCPEE